MQCVTEGDVILPTKHVSTNVGVRVGTGMDLGLIDDLMGVRGKDLPGEGRATVLNVIMWGAAGQSGVICIWVIRGSKIMHMGLKEIKGTHVMEIHMAG